MTHAKKQINNKMLGKKPISWLRVIFIISFIIIPTVHFLITYVYVNIDSILMSFQITKGDETYWTFENFIRFYQQLAIDNSEMRIAFKNTFLTFLINEIMFVVSFFVSYFAAFSSVRVLVTRSQTWLRAVWRAVTSL